jgi:hypothetical protein
MAPIVLVLHPACRIYGERRTAGDGRRPRTNHDVARPSRLRGSELPGAVLTSSLVDGGVFVGEREVASAERGNLAPAQPVARAMSTTRCDVAAQTGAQPCPFAVLQEPDLPAQFAVPAEQPGVLAGVVGGQTETLLPAHQDREQPTLSVAEALPGRREVSLLEGLSPGFTIRVRYSNS